MKRIDAEFEEFSRAVFPPAVLESPKLARALRHSFWSGALTVFSLLSVAAIDESGPEQVSELMEQLANEFEAFRVSLSDPSLGDLPVMKAEATQH